MNHSSVFSGIGACELAATWMGWENIFHCDKDKFCQKILKKHYPKSVLYEDIKATEFIRYRGLIDVFTAGFPCQPFSEAGLRKGTEDDRHLWPETIRAVREIQPDWFVGENVLGIISWSKGMVFNKVQTDLEAEGYEVFPYVLPACGIGAPHRRDRVWFIAHAIDSRYRNIGEQDSRQNRIQGIRREAIYAGESNGADTLVSDTDTDNAGLQGRKINGGIRGGGTFTEQFSAGLLQSAWENFPTESPLCGADDGIPDRIHRIRALGNSMVPQIVYQIFKAIEQYENNK